MGEVFFNLNHTKMKMKNLFLILVIGFFLSSCEKHEEPILEPAVKTLTGSWILYQTFTSGETFSWTVNIIQSGNSLAGSVVISDGSGYASLSPISNISGGIVTIEWLLPTTTYKFSCHGGVSAGYTSMSGTFYVNGIKGGTWNANRK